MSAARVPSPARPWRTTAQVEHLVAWRDADLAVLARTAQAAVAAWAAAWGVAGELLPVRCAPAADAAAAASWDLLGCAGPAAAWVALEPSFKVSLGVALWGVDHVATAVAGDVLAACRQDLLAQLAAAAGVQRPAAGGSQGRCVPQGRWCGAVVVELGQGARVLLDAHVVRALVRGGAPPVARAEDPAPMLGVVTEAIAARTLALRVQLADCELDVGGLRNLQVGDVVRLPHRLDVPLHVRDDAGQAVFGAFLARRGGFKAVELAPPASVAAAAPERTLP